MKKARKVQQQYCQIEYRWVQFKLYLFILQILAEFGHFHPPPLSKAHNYMNLSKVIYVAIAAYRKHAKNWLEKENWKIMTNFLKYPLYFSSFSCIEMTLGRMAMNWKLTKRFFL